jgi:hypothetical protein
VGRNGREHARQAIRTGVRTTRPAPVTKNGPAQSPSERSAAALWGE